MAVQFRAASSATFDATSGSISAPAFTAGDLMVLVVSTDAGVTITTPTGWALVAGSNLTTSGGHTDCRTSIYTRTAVAGDTSWTVTLSAGGTTTMGISAYYDDVGGTVSALPLASATAAGNPGPTSEATATITTNVANARVLSIWTTHYFVSPGTLTVDAATTQRVNVFKSNAGGSSFSITAITDEAKATAGLTAARTATVSGSGQNWIAYQLQMGVQSTVTGSGASSALLKWSATALDAKISSGTSTVLLKWAATAKVASPVTTSLPLKWAAVTAVLLETTSWIGDDVEQWQVPFEWSCLATINPVEDAPAVPDPYIKRVSITMPAPTLINGSPQQPWTPSIARSDWGTLQLVIGGVDRSRPRGKPFLALDWVSTEPFGDAEATFVLPGLTEFDDPAVWGITALAPVLLRRKDAVGVFHTIYEGDIAAVDPDDGQGLVIECLGALYRLDLLKEPPPLIVRATDAGRLIANAVNDKRRRYLLNVNQMPVVTTGITAVGDSGSFKPFLTGFVQDQLSKMGIDNGSQWTLAHVRPRTPVLRLKDVTTVHATVSYGAPGVEVKLSKDFTAATTAVYGTGSNGHCSWMGARFPNLTQGSSPAFPLGVGATFIAADGQTGFAEFAAFLRRGQYGQIESDDTYLASDFDSVEQFQSRAHITVDGIVGAQTWEAAFQPGANQGSLQGAYVDTIYEKPETRRRIYNAQGADVGPNPLFDPSVPRIEDYIPFGDNVSKAVGTASAREIIDRAYPAGRSGTIVLRSDPAECSRFDLDGGMNIKVDNYNGGSVLLHITRREASGLGQVTLTVDEKAHDDITRAIIHQRDKDVADQTRRPTHGRNRSQTFNDYGQWLCEDGAGHIPLMNQQAGFWNVQRIAAAPKGTIERISLAIGSGLTQHKINQAVAHTITSITGAARAAMLIFDGPVTANAITNLSGMSTPLTALGDGTNPVDHNQDALDAMGLIYAAGGPGSALGFYPNNDPGDGSDTNLTGMFEDGGSIQFGPTGHVWLWLAIWCPVSSKVGGRIFPGAPG